MKPELTKKYVNYAYNVENLSFREIAAILDTYPNKVRRFAIRNGIQPRDKGTAQSLALETGRHTHPTKGTKRPPSVKDKISDTMAQNWADMSEEEYERRVQMGKEAWDALTYEDKEAMRIAAGDAIRRSSKDGSKMEHFIKEGLTQAGFLVEFHKEGLIPNFKLQIDLFIPELSTAIEVDGPSHFSPIWGDKNFHRNVRADQEKAGLITSVGMVLIRVKCVSKTISGKTMRNALRGVIDALQKIRVKRPEQHERLIEIEV